MQDSITMAEVGSMVKFSRITTLANHPAKPGAQEAQLSVMAVNCLAWT
jgi:hypothetical protein